MATGTLNGNRPPLGEQGYGFDGLTQGDGIVVEWRYPSDWDIDRMQNYDAQAQAIDLGLTLPIRRNRWDIVDRPGGKRIGDFVRSVLSSEASEGGMSTSMRTVVAQMTTAIGHGKACFEKVWQPQGNRVVYDKIAFRPARTCRIKLDTHGGFNGFVQQGVTSEGIGYGPITFAPDKSFVYLHGGHMNPGQGRSAYLSAYNRYQHKQKVESLLFEYLGRVTGGIKKAQLTEAPPAGNEDALRAKAEDLFDRVRSARGMATIVLAPDEALDVMEASGEGSREFASALLYLNQEMARSVLCQFLMLGAQANTGAWALSRDHSDFFLQTLEAIMREMENAINDHLIGPLVIKNFGPNAKFPRFKFDTLATEARQYMIELFRDFALAGFFTLPEGMIDALFEGARVTMDMPPEAILDRDGSMPKPGPPDPSITAPIQEPPKPGSGGQAGEAQAATTVYGQRAPRLQGPGLLTRGLIG